MLSESQKQQVEARVDQFMRDYHQLPWDKGCSLVRQQVYALESSNAELRAMAERLLQELSLLADAGEIDQGH